MSAPRLEIRLSSIEHNTRTLVERLGLRGISVSGVTKATLGDPQIARAMIAGGVTSLSDSRVENIERLRRAGVTTEISLIRSPMISQADRVVAAADVSLNSEVAVLRELSAAALRQDRTHGVIIMVELGDLREGVMPDDLEATIRQTLTLGSLVVRGIGTNLACQSGVVPDASNMAELSHLATAMERSLGLELSVITGGNSANIAWALGAHDDIGRVNQLRLGESILLGCDPVDRSPIEGLESGAFTIVGEVIEAKAKPSDPRGTVGQSAFGEPRNVRGDAHSEHRLIIALGRQDLDAEGITASPTFAILGASSDHLVLGCEGPPPDVGSEVSLLPNYASLLRAMTSPFVALEHLGGAA